MIKLEKTNVMNFENAVRGARNPMNSWEKSDSYYDIEEDPSPINPDDWVIYRIGPNDHELCMKLCKAGSDHRKFMRQIFVSVDITAPLYWWKEYDTYKVGTTANSCSTMHKIHSKKLSLGDFSCDRLVKTNDGWVADADGCKWFDPLTSLETIIHVLNACRDNFIATNNKIWWYQMIQLLPTSYNQLRTCTLTYENLANIYHARRNHKLDEWHRFCEWIESLPYSEFITLKEPESDIEILTNLNDRS